MKRLTIFAIISIVFAACKKEFVPENNSFLEQIKQGLSERLNPDIYRSVDFSRAVRSRVNEGTSFVSIPIKNKVDAYAFLLLKASGKGSIYDGRIISLEVEGERREGNTMVNGFISIDELDGARLISSEVRSGYVTALHRSSRSTIRRGANGLSLVAPVHPGPEYVELPEVVVIGTRSSSGGYTYGLWMCFSAMFNSGGGSGGSGYYGSVDGPSGGYSGGGGGGGGNASGEPVQEGQVIIIDYESDDTNPAIDIEKYVKCFSNVPDAGASCSIEIFADIPVDSDPNKLLNWQTGSPGHVFLQINKTNGSQSITQNIGFYPSQGWKVTLTPAPVPGKFVDNAGHEFNASLKMAITPDQLQSALVEMLYLARFIKYDVDEYNCTDFALDVFNKMRNDKLSVPTYDIPGGLTAGGTRTPQGLYNMLKEKQRSGGAEASNIKIPGVKGWVGASSGPCN